MEHTGPGPGASRKSQVCQPRCQRRCCTICCSISMRALPGRRLARCTIERPDISCARNGRVVRVHQPYLCCARSCAGPPSLSRSCGRPCTRTRMFTAGRGDNGGCAWGGGWCHFMRWHPCASGATGILGERLQGPADSLEHYTVGAYVCAHSNIVLSPAGHCQHVRPPACSFPSVSLLSI